MKINAPVSTLMTADPITLSPTDKLQKAKEIFGTNNIHHIPVCKGGALVGMLSKTDYLYFIRPLDKESREPYLNEIRLKNFTVAEAMSKHVVQVSSNDTLSSALEILTENQFHALPVVDDGQLKGILTSHDFLFRLLHPSKILS